MYNSTLSKEDGRGYLIEFHDLPGCISNGDTIEEAVKNEQDAVICWIDAPKKSKRAVPKPGELEKQSGKRVQRVPKSIHLQLIEKAHEEGVNLHDLIK